MSGTKTKRCLSCGVRKETEAFYRNVQEGRPNQASHRPECKKCSKQRRERKLKVYKREFK